MSIVCFVFSYPYENALLKLGGFMLMENYSKDATKKTKIAQKIWDKYEKQILDLFKEIYQIEISEKSIIVFMFRSF